MKNIPYLLRTHRKNEGADDIKPNDCSLGKKLCKGKVRFLYGSLTNFRPMEIFKPWPSVWNLLACLLKTYVIYEISHYITDHIHGVIKYPILISYLGFGLFWIFICLSKNPDHVKIREEWRFKVLETTQLIILLVAVAHNYLFIGTDLCLVCKMFISSISVFNVEFLIDFFKKM